MPKYQILLTNDDGIPSPGLWAAAQALSALGYVHVAAPMQQFSGAGRSLSGQFDGRIERRMVEVSGQQWPVYAIDATPAGTVQHAILEVLDSPPDLLVTGINYGENPGSGVTVSGTIGAALEGAAFGVPALAVSLETEPRHHYSYSDEVDFTAAAAITAHLAGLLLGRRLPFDVDVLKVEIPCEAGPDTPWRLARLSRGRYFELLRPQRHAPYSPGRIGYRLRDDFSDEPTDSDAHVLKVQRLVAVTPLSLDLTSRIDMAAFERELRAAHP